MTTTTATPGTGGRLRQLGVDTRYVLLGFPLSVLTIAVFATLLGLGVGLAVLVIGIPVLAGLLIAARVLGGAERARAAQVLGRPIPAPQRPAGLRRTVTDAPSWLAVAHGLVRIVPSTVAFAVVVAWWAVALAGLSAPFWDWAVPRGADSVDLPELIGIGSGATARIWLYMVAGLFFALTLMPVVHGMARMEARLAERMLRRHGAGEWSAVAAPWAPAWAETTAPAPASRPLVGAGHGAW